MEEVGMGMGHGLMRSVENYKLIHYLRADYADVGAHYVSPASGGS